MAEFMAKRAERQYRLGFARFCATVRLHTVITTAMRSGRTILLSVHCMTHVIRTLNG
jgi:hypothetical protein